MATFPSITAAPTASDISTSVTQANSATTPFVVPHDCPYYNEWTWESTTQTDIASSLPTDNALSSIVLYPSNALFCMPSDWNRKGAFEFAPGVCPQDWTMYDIAKITSVAPDPLLKGGELATAYCCPSGYTITPGSQISMSSACVQSWTSGDAAANITVDIQPDRAMGGLSHSTFSYGEAIQPPWHISWTLTFGYILVDSLTPQPPSISGSSTIRSWIPTVSSTLTSRQTYSPAQISSAPYSDQVDKNSFQMSIAIPVVVVIVSVGICTGWYFKLRKRKRQRMRAEAEERIAREETASGQVDGNGSEHPGPEDVPVIFPPPAYVKEEVQTIELPPAYAPPRRNTGE